MSTVKISELPVLSSADAADEFVVVDDSAGVTKKITFDSLATDVRSESEPLTASTVTASGLLTASAGINFGSDTLDDYEEGTWTPSANVISFASVKSARYIKIGSQVTVQAFVIFPTTSDGNALYLNDLPFAVVNSDQAFYPGSLWTNSGMDDYLLARPNTSRIEVRNGSNGNNTPNHAYSGDSLIVNLTYETS